MRFDDGIDERDLYALLGVSQAATAADIRRGYHTQAKLWHPDQNKQHGEATRRMAAINGAFERLGDPVKRQQYDESLKPEQRPKTASEPTGAGPPRHDSADPTETRGPRPSRRRTQPRARAVSLVAYFRARELHVIDKRSKGGALWVVGGPELGPVMELLRRRGFAFDYAAKGGRATNHKPAWWTESPG